VIRPSVLRRDVTVSIFRPEAGPASGHQWGDDSGRPVVHRMGGWRRRSARDPPHRHRNRQSAVVDD